MAFLHSPGPVRFRQLSRAMLLQLSMLTIVVQGEAPSLRPMENGGSAQLLSFKSWARGQRTGLAWLLAATQGCRMYSFLQVPQQGHIPFFFLGLPLLFFLLGWL